MATYGRGQMLGSGISPESFKQDYSGFARAAEIQAQGISNLGASIGGAIKDFGEEKKKINQDIAKGKSALQFAKANYPELASRIDEIGKIFSDVNVSKADQAAAGSQMGDFVTAMIRGQEFNTEVELKKRALGIQEAEALARNATSPKSANLQLGEIRETINGKPYDVKVTFDPATGETRRLDGSIVSQGSRNPAIIDAGLNLPMPTAEGTAMPGDGTFPDYGGISDAMVLPSIDPNDIAAAVELTGGQSDVSNVSPMPMGTPTTTQTPVVDGIPAGQAGGEMIPPGATLVAEEQTEVRALTNAEKQKMNLPAGEYVGKFVDGKLTATPTIIPAKPDTMERLQENRMLKADDRISTVIESTDRGAERLIGMEEALSLLNSGEVKSGAFGAYKVKAARLLGMDVASEEQFNSLVGNLAMEAIDLTKGAISDREMKFFREELAPGINKSVEGNKKIIKFKIAAAKRGVRINQVAREMLAKNALPADIEAAIKKIQKEESLISRASTGNKPASQEPLTLEDELDKVLRGEKIE